MKTQWIVSTYPEGLRRYEGLNYAALPVVEQRLGLAPAEQTFADLQVMEAAGREVLNDE